ncbi:MAG: glycerate kinase [Roseivirga sp.]|nr:glycerate kinase [Roseivirga sp.]
MRVVIAPDKFKGTLSANEVCLAIAQGIRDFDPSIEVVSHPLADGGEGTLDLLEDALNLKRIPLKVRDPLYREIKSYYLRNETSAFIEMALASGLQLLRPEERNPFETSTHGTGELIKHAINNGARHIYLMIGGSATNDGGAGMAEALGFQFQDERGRSSGMNGGNLGEISDVLDKTDGLLAGVDFTVLTDVQNLLLGPDGASFVYGRQKGADDEMVVVLEQSLGMLKEILNNGFENIAGAGAAGGLGYGAMSFLGAELKSGIETVMEITGFDTKLGGADLIISGEGKMDLQTVEGKVIAGVSKKARELEVPFSVICGIAEEVERVQASLQAESIHPLVNEHVSPEMAMANSFALVRERAYELIMEFAQKN